MKQYIKKLSMVLVMMTFALIVAMTVPTEAKAAFKSSPQGEVTKCGSYYIKRNKTGIYKSKKKSSGFKLVVKAATSKAKDDGKYAYGFTSDGKTIYYAVNDNKTNKGNIYSIKATGKSKKTIYKAKHQVNVYYAYGGKIMYKSDVLGKKNFRNNYIYCLDPKSTAKTKYTLIRKYEPYGSVGEITLRSIEFQGKYAIITENYSGESYFYYFWDFVKMKKYEVGYTDVPNGAHLKNISDYYYIEDGYFYFINQFNYSGYSDVCVKKRKIGSEDDIAVTRKYKGMAVSLKPGEFVFRDYTGNHATHTITF